MRIGVVCEGPTDFIAISRFLKASLSHRGIDASFKDIQPKLDASSVSSGGGWSNVLIWLKNNPPQARKLALFGDGLFSNGLSEKKCDLILIQIDTDVLDDDSFLNYVKNEMNTHPIVHPISQPNLRYDAAERILLFFSGFSSTIESQKNSHIIAPAVENTETWCVAVRKPNINNVENLNKAEIFEEFKTRLLDSEGPEKLRGGFKSQRRRQKYCLNHENNVSRLEGRCSQYLRALQQILQSLPNTTA